MLECSGMLQPTSERLIRPLAALEPEQQLEVWQRVVETAPERNPAAAWSPSSFGGVCRDLCQSGCCW